MNQHTTVLPETLQDLLMQRRVVVEQAPRAVLQTRLDERLLDKRRRCSKRAGGDADWPRSVSDDWLQQEIDHLTRALGGT